MPPVEHSSPLVSRTSPTSRWQRIGPVICLLLLAPIIAELLFGVIRIRAIWVLINEIFTWGCGASLIREFVRRWRKGWQSMLLMGLALAIAEEWVIQQTSISPLVGPVVPAYGRAWGVNWVYFLWALGYWSVWVVLIPVQLAELLFPARREESWLRARGLVIASIAFLLGACAAWYGWTQRARVKIFHMQPYSPPPLCLLIGVATIPLLILAAYALPSGRSRKELSVSRSAPSPCLVGLALFALGFPWAAFILLGWGRGALPNVPFGVVLAGGLAWATFTFSLARRWTFCRDWGDSHRYATVFGGILACMLGGFVVFKVGGAQRIDWIFKAILNAAAVVWLLSLRTKVKRRA
jgi:hypothetical protein